VQPRDRLLPDVAALGEAHGALVEAGLLRDDGVVEVDAVARAPAFDAQHVGGGLVGLHRAGRQQGGLHALGVGAVADDVDADVGAHEAHGRVADLRSDVCVLLGLRGLSPQSGFRLRPDQREQATLQRALVQLAVEADVEAPQRVEQRLQR